MNNNQVHIAVIVLAAGEGSRMQSIKQLLPYKDSNLLEHALKSALNSRATNTICVLGAHAKTIRNQLPENVKFIINDAWKTGMGSSIASGVNYVSTNIKDLKGIIITLADQPFVSSAYIDHLLETAQDNPNTLIATRYKDSAGVPAFFPKKYFADLSSLQPKEGAKKLLNTLIKAIILITPDFKNIDIDTPDDYSKLIKD